MKNKLKLEKKKKNSQLIINMMKIYKKLSKK